MTATAWDGQAQCPQKPDARHNGPWDRRFAYLPAGLVPCALLVLSGLRSRVGGRRRSAQEVLPWQEGAHIPTPCRRSSYVWRGPDAGGVVGGRIRESGRARTRSELPIEPDFQVLRRDPFVVHAVETGFWVSTGLAVPVGTYFLRTGTFLHTGAGMEDECLASAPCRAWLVRRVVPG
ncbi:hypothetical protein VTK73DRAFT_2076 [Phialemonium thermophilum]|uniref:Uncharacterized protein n=1 Tax=Phialemonium thermophilum TaxID=223376 RepID=A0ABR3VSK7_9PEZI